LKDKEIEAARWQEHKKNLTDVYIKDLLTSNRAKKVCSLKRADLPPELVALKRKEIQIKRELDKMRGK